MSLEQELNDQLKQAMRDKDARSAEILRMLKTKIMERRTTKGFTGTVDDALVLDVIAVYRKQMHKAVGEFQAAGERGAEQVRQLQEEVAFCDRFLPKGLDEAALEALVKERIEALGITSSKEVGKLLGDLMKTHKGLVDAADVKRIVASLLG